MPKPAIAFLTTLSLVALPFNTIAIDVPPLTVCGSTMGQIVGAQIMEVLQATLGGYSFDVACQAHDACYGDCKTTKADCDKKLLTDAEGVCESARLRNFCISDAQGAFLLVSKMGEVPFREARANCSATALQNYPDAGTGGGGGVGVASTVGISKQGGRDAASASAVKVGSVTQGQLEVPQDQHYFRFTPQHRANYVVYTRGPTQTTGELYDERFNPLANNSFGGGGQNFRISQQLEPGRTYYVLVRGQPGPYSLHVDGPESLYSATEIKVGSVTTGEMQVPRDQSYFRFTPQHRANYVIYTRGPTQTTGELYDERFNPLANNSFGGGGQNFRISQQLEPGRTYYVLVRGQPGPYSLHVDGPESLYSATEIKVGSVTTGEMQVPRDQSYFRFTPQHRANYVIYTRGPTQTFGELYDERFNPLANNSFGGGGQNFRISQQLEPGRTYYVLVRGQPGPYSLHVDGPESLYSATELKMGSSTVPQCRSTEITNLARAALKDKAAGITFGYLCQPYIQTGLGLHAHAGIDLKAAERTPVYAIASGDVVAVDRQSLGKLMIKLPDGKRLIYLHLSRIDVHEGQSVSIGDPLGLSGSKGTDSPHLHIEVRTNYSGKFALGGDSCGGECSAAQVGDKTVDPAAVVSR